MRQLHRLFATGCLCALLSQPVVLAQQGKTAAEPPTDAFIKLREQRRQLLEKRDSQEAEIKKIEAQKNTRISVENTAKEKKEKLDLAIRRTPPDRLGIQQAQRDYDEALDDVKRSGNLDSTALTFQVQQLNREREKTASDLQATDESINRLLNLEIQQNTFKTRMALGFAVVVVIVFLGFCAIVWKNQDLFSKTIAHDGGSRLLSMFLLVTVVGLVGITGTIESKDLTSLVIGLGGYVLGRYETSKGKHE